MSATEDGTPKNPVGDINAHGTSPDKKHVDKSRFFVLYLCTLPQNLSEPRSRLGEKPSRSPPTTSAIFGRPFSGSKLSLETMSN